jgi:hypothetical protein
MKDKHLIMDADSYKDFLEFMRNQQPTDEILKNGLVDDDIV